MKRVIFGMILGLAIGGQGVLLGGVNTPTVPDDKTYSRVQGYELLVIWEANDKTTVKGQVFGEDGSGGLIPDTRTNIRIDVPATSGAPSFNVTGHAINNGITASCTGGRNAVLATTNDMRDKLEAYATSCLNP